MRSKYTFFWTCHWDIHRQWWRCAPFSWFCRRRRLRRHDSRRQVCVSVGAIIVVTLHDPMVSVVMTTWRHLLYNPPSQKLTDRQNSEKQREHRRKRIVKKKVVSFSRFLFRTLSHLRVSFPHTYNCMYLSLMRHGRIASSVSHAGERDGTVKIHWTEEKKYPRAGDQRDVSSRRKQQPSAITTQVTKPEGERIQQRELIHQITYCPLFC